MLYWCPCRPNSAFAWHYMAPPGLMGVSSLWHHYFGVRGLNSLGTPVLDTKQCLLPPFQSAFLHKPWLMSLSLLPCTCCERSRDAGGLNAVMSGCTTSWAHTATINFYSTLDMVDVSFFDVIRQSMVIGCRKASMLLKLNILNMCQDTIDIKIASLALLSCCTSGPSQRGA